MWPSCGLVTVVVLVPGRCWEAPQTRSSLRVPFVMPNGARVLMAALASFVLFGISLTETESILSSAKNIKSSHIQDWHKIKSAVLRLSAASGDSSDLFFTPFQNLKNMLRLASGLQEKIPTFLITNVFCPATSLRAAICVHTRRNMHAYNRPLHFCSFNLTTF